MKVVLRRTARDDLQQIVDWLAEQNPATATRVLDRLLADCDDLWPYPDRFERIAPTTRRRVSGRYLVYYEVTPTEVAVLRILDGRRDLDVSGLGSDA